MELIQLTSDYEMKPFDCGNATRSIEFVIRLVLRIRIYNPINCDCTEIWRIEKSLYSMTGG